MSEGQLLYRLSPPAPLLGGTRVYCPMVDVPRIESGRYRPGDPIRCPWSRKGKRALKRYRRHWYRAHWEPFSAETRSLVSLARLGSPSRITG